MLLALLAASPSSTGPSPFVSLAPFALIMLIFYFIWFRPAQRRQQSLQKLLAELKKGDKVVTSGGLYGDVVRVDGAVVLLKVADGVRVRVAKSAITGLADSAEERRER